MSEGGVTLPRGDDVTVRLLALEAENQQLRKELAVRDEVGTALQVSEQLYRELVQSAIDGICVLRDQVLTYVNPRLCAMMESAPDALIGTSFTQHLAPEERDRTVGLYRRMTQREAFPQRYETVLVNLSGRRLDVAVSANMIDVDGTPSVVLVVRDIAGQKQARQMAIENERLEAIRSVARGVGNNYSNILSVISSYAVSIADSFLPNTRPHESARHILEAARHASDLTKRLLGVVRVSGAEAGVRLEPVGVAAMLQKAYELIAPTLKERGIAFELQEDEPDLYALVDAGQLLDVFMNIYLNGADAMSSGGALAVRLATHQQEQAGQADPGTFTASYVEVSISDTGVGMSAEQVARVFEPFFTTKKNSEAFGLGLPVAQSMVKGWGGWLEITSQPDQGTRVRILMPRVDKPADFAAADQASRTVLVIDDHDECRRLMVQALLADGHAVIDTGSGEEAITLYQERAGEIDLVVLDWIMPGVDGRDVLQVIQDHDTDKRVLMTSGFSRDFVRSQIRLGAWAFLQKPFSEAQFKAAVRKALDVLSGA